MKAITGRYLFFRAALSIGLSMGLSIAACSSPSDDVTVRGVGEQGRQSVAETTFVVATTPDPTTTARANADTIPLVDITDETAAALSLLHQLDGHRGRLLLATFVQNDTLATFGHDGILNFWDTRSGALLMTQQIFQIGLAGAANADRTWAVLIGDNNLMVRVSLDPQNTDATQYSRVLTDQALSVAIGPLGRVAVGLPDGVGQVFSPDLSQPLFEIAYTRPPNDTTAIAWNGDGTILVTGYPDSSLLVWDGITGQRLNRPTDPGGWVQVLTTSPDGETFASGDSDNVVLLWNFATQTVQDRIEGAHGRDVGGIAYSPDGTLLATTGQDGQARVWSLVEDAANQPLFRYVAGPIDSDFWTRTPTFSPNGQLLAIGDDDGQVYVFGVVAGAESGIEASAE